MHKVCKLGSLNLITYVIARKAKSLRMILKSLIDQHIQVKITAIPGLQTNFFSMSTVALELQF